jgi:hypothetical protein
MVYLDILHEIFITIKSRKEYIKCKFVETEMGQIGKLE